MILDDTKVRNADKIFVLEEGRIQEEGTHAELIAKSGLYFNLVKKQSTSKSMGDLANVEEESLGTDREDNEMVRKKSGEVATRSSVNTPLSELVVPADVIREIAEREKEEQLQTSLWRVLKINPRSGRSSPWERSPPSAWPRSPPPSPSSSATSLRSCPGKT